MSRGPLKRWRERGGRSVRVSLPFADIMEVALALLALSPEELVALGWTFADRKRLLDHFLASGKEAQKADRASLDQTLLTLRLPVRDIQRLQRFARRELPKAATHAGIIERLSRVLAAAIAPPG
ncbi:hypothetical protein HL653_10750 [Sphingomonas sp. AP4-R1]|uniref:hypothetical protein n=1 Tax=Sphingomonas sp. AP4-R1 TaxID=2735134 RepID=UPI0014937DE3|nr:hypothetical protein [Sphingomonas sp. AP4-R1]QJU58208.1 hypothetical protein HL653_10750 [Sphingomonas sp. AP4-R1]